MTNENEAQTSQRRVYVLPTELVERIVAFQKEMGIPSEVEAARRLLDDALKFRDDWRSLTERFRLKLAELRDISDAARDVLVGHPLVETISFMRRGVSFSLTTGEQTEVDISGEVSAKDAGGREFFTAPAFDLDEQGRPRRAYLPF